MGLIYFFWLPAFESPGIFCCDAPFIVPNPDLAFAGLAIEFHQHDPDCYRDYWTYVY